MTFSQKFNDTLFTTAGDTIRCEIISLDKNNVLFITKTKNAFYTENISRVFVKNIMIDKGNIHNIVIKGNIDTLINLAGYGNLARMKQLKAEKKIKPIHDSIKPRIYPPAKLNIKISSLIFSGEIPLFIEYRPFKHFGNEFSIGYAYLNPLGVESDPAAGEFLHFDAFFCKGYNMKYGIRFYLPVNKGKTNYFYINPDIFYKQIWENNIMHIDYEEGHGAGSDEQMDYYYDFNKKAIGGQFLCGFSFAIIKKITVEFYLGLGWRTIKTNTKYTKFESSHGYWGGFDPNNLPASASDHYKTFTPQFGYNWSFPIW